MRLRIDNISEIHKCHLLERLYAARHPMFNDHTAELLILIEILNRKRLNNWNQTCK